jgi:hypothetical protein
MTDERRDVVESFEPDPELQLGFTLGDRHVTDAEIDPLRELARSGTVEAARRPTLASGPAGRQRPPSPYSRLRSPPRPPVAFRAQRNYPVLPRSKSMDSSDPADLGFPALSSVST